MGYYIGLSACVRIVSWSKVMSSGIYEDYVAIHRGGCNSFAPAAFIRVVRITILKQQIVRATGFIKMLNY